ncbi:MAG: NarL family two-component response regulator [Actinomycetia bacterium]|nr:NarL family two-component response regulator [Actinomycetes bacterium]
MMEERAAVANASEIGVLICDDLEAMRKLLRIVVELRPGLRVLGEACDGNEAVAEAGRLQPDVILLDLSMPGRTGFDALPEIAQVAPEAKVIVLSGFVAPTTARAVLALGAARCIEKGASPGEIAAAIEEVAAKRLPVVPIE